MDQISDCNIELVKDIIDDLPYCVWVKKSSKPLGQGARGTAYSICCQRGDSLDCKYIIKIIKRGKKGLESFEKGIEKEVILQKDFSSLGLAPHIVKAFMCEHEGIIIMERVDTDIIKYVDQLIYDSNISTQEAINEINRIQEDFLYILKVSYEAGLIHDDLHGENLALNLKNDRYYKSYFIDFGESYYKKDKKTSSLKELEHDMILTFDSLRKKINNKKTDDLLSPSTPIKRYKSPPKIDKRKKREMSSPIAKKNLFSSFSFDD